MNKTCGENSYCIESIDGNISCLCLPDYHLNPSGGIDCIGELLLYYISYYCILCGQIKGLNRSITTIMCEDGSYRTVVG